MAAAEKRAWVTEAELDRHFWTESFVERWSDLVFGMYDHDDIKAWALKLYQTKGHLNPWRVANDELRASSCAADYLPGGQYWKVLQPDVN